jgi:hypothetical protein
VTFDALEHGAAQSSAKQKHSDAQCTVIGTTGKTMFTYAFATKALSETFSKTLRTLGASRVNFTTSHCISLVATKFVQFTSRRFEVGLSLRSTKVNDATMLGDNEQWVEASNVESRVGSGGRQPKRVDKTP